MACRKPNKMLWQVEIKGLQVLPIILRWHLNANSQVLRLQKTTEEKNKIDYEQYLLSSCERITHL
jgi:hypothetical protein